MAVKSKLSTLRRRCEQIAKKARSERVQLAALDILRKIVETESRVVEAQPVRELLIYYHDELARRRAEAFLAQGHERSWVRSRIGGELYDALMSPSIGAAPGARRRSSRPRRPAPV